MICSYCVVQFHTVFGPYYETVLDARNVEPRSTFFLSCLSSLLPFPGLMSHFCENFWSYICGSQETIRDLDRQEGEKSEKRVVDFGGRYGSTVLLE